MITADKNEFKSIVKNFDLEEQAIAAEKINDSILMRELFNRLADRKLKLDGMREIMEGTFYGNVNTEED